jgi:hypothetical protein
VTFMVVGWIVYALMPASAASSEAETHGDVVIYVAAIGIAITFTLIRGAVLGALNTINPGDVLRLRRPIAFLETMLTIVGVIVASLWPIIGLMLAIAVLLSAVIAILIVRSAIGSVPCANCARAMHPSALACARCAHPVASPKKIGLLGCARKDNVDDVDRHRIHLVLAGRCPTCAEQINAIDRACRACGSEISVTRDAIARESARESRMTLLITFVSALIPIVGLPLAFLVVRLSPADGVRRYVPASTRVLLNIGVILLLMFLQPVPLVGAVLVTVFFGARMALERAQFSVPRGRKLH